MKIRLIGSADLVRAWGKELEASILHQRRGVSKPLWQRRD